MPRCGHDCCKIMRLWWPIGGGAIDERREGSVPWDPRAHFLPGIGLGRLGDNSAWIIFFNRNPLILDFIYSRPAGAVPRQFFVILCVHNTS
jgi:hypothetical protein